MHNVMTDEIWKDIEGYEGVYMISSYGRVKNCNRNKLLNPWEQYGYRKVELSYLGIKQVKPVHRLVASAFIDNPANLETVDHINGNKGDNRVDNLRWCTREDNARWANSRGFSMLSPLGEIVTFHNMTEFCRDNDLTQSNLHKVYSGERLSHKGWRSLNAY